MKGALTAAAVHKQYEEGVLAFRRQIGDAALRLRAMHLLYESVRETGGTVVVPSSFSEGFGDVLGDNVKKVVGGEVPPAL